MAKHSDIAEKLGNEIKRLEEKASEETDRRLRVNYQKRINDILAFLNGPLVEDQKQSAEAMKQKKLAEAKSAQDLEDIEGEFNMGEGEAFIQKLGGIMPQYKCGGKLTRHGVLGNIANSVGQVISDPIGTTQSMVQNAASNPASTAVGGAIGGGAGTAIGAGIGTLLGGPIGTIAGSLAGGHIGTNLGLQQGGQGWDALNPFASTSGGAPTPADQGPGQQQLPPPPPPGMGGGMPGYKMVHDAYYKNGGRLSRHQTDPFMEVVDTSNAVNPVMLQLDSIPYNFNPTMPVFNPNIYSNAAGTPTTLQPTNLNPDGSIPTDPKPTTSGFDWGAIPWNSIGGAAGQMMTNQMATAPMQANAALLAGPREYIYNPFYNAEEANLIRMENMMMDNYRNMMDLATMEEYYSPSRALDENRALKEDMIRASEDLSGAEKLLYQDKVMGDAIDRATDIVADYTELNKMANSPSARLSKLGSVAPFLDAIYGRTGERGAGRTAADLQAWMWNNQVENAVDNLKMQQAENIAEYGQGLMNDQYLSSALNMGGGYWGFTPGMGMGWNMGMYPTMSPDAYRDFYDWQTQQQEIAEQEATT
jgi:hypothetical protein